MAHFIYLWKPARVAEMLERSLGLNHIAGEQLKRVSPNDHVWIISVYEGNLWLAGHLHVDKILNISEAEAFLGETNLYTSEFHAVTRPEDAEPLRNICVHEIAAELRFNSQIDRLKIEEDGSINAQQLQAMRELTPESADGLEGIWYCYEDKGDEGDEGDEGDDDIVPEIKEQFASLEHRLEVEAASVEFATAQLEREGWQVESVEAQKTGYDLHCTKGDRSCLHVEVKGTSGEDQLFIITANELAQANSDSEFILFLVTKALDSHPSLQRFTGQELIASFNFQPMQYRASKKT